MDFEILGLLLCLTVFLVLGITFIVGLCKTYKKMCGRSWVPLIPIYGTYVLNTEIQHRPVGLVLISIVSTVNFVLSEIIEINLIIFVIIGIVDFGYYLILTDGISRGFGKGKGFTFGLVFLPFIFYPILGFSKDVFNKNIFEVKDNLVNGD